MKRTYILFKTEFGVTAVQSMHKTCILFQAESRNNTSIDAQNLHSLSERIWTQLFCWVLDQHLVCSVANEIEPRVQVPTAHFPEALSAPQSKQRTARHHAHKRAHRTACKSQVGDNRRACKLWIENHLARKDRKTSRMEETAELIKT